TTVTGFVIFDEVMAHFVALERDPQRPGMMNVLIDIRGMTSTPETGQLRRAAERISPGKSELQFGACAIVAVDPSAVGMGKLFAVFAREQFRASIVVSTIEEAERWLGLHPQQ